MGNILVIASKEFADMIRSKRFIGLLAVFLFFYLAGISFMLTFMYSSGAPPRRLLILVLRNLQNTLAFIAPLLGIALGFDAISGEREKGTLKIVLSQPVFRDELINGKILAYLAVVVLTLFSASFLGLGIMTAYLGMTVTLDDVLRLLALTGAALLLSAAFYSVALLLSVLTRKTSHSGLIAISFWLITVIILPMVGTLVAFSILGPPPRIVRQPGQPPTSFQKQQLREYWDKFRSITTTINSFSLTFHFNRIASNILKTYVVIGAPGQSPQQAQKQLTLSEALSQCLPNIGVLTTVTLIALFATYMIFVRQEER